MPDKHFSDWNTSEVQQLHFLVKCHFSANYNHEYITQILEIIYREKKNWGAEWSNENSLLVDTKKVSAVIDTAGEQKGKHTLYHSYFRLLMVLSTKGCQAAKLPPSIWKNTEARNCPRDESVTSVNWSWCRCYDEEIHKHREIGWESEQEPSQGLLPRRWQLKSGDKNTSWT